MALSMKQKAAGFNTEKLASPVQAERSQKGAVSLHVESVYRDRALARENDQIKTLFEAFDGAIPAKALDPETVRPSKWANRFEQSFAGKEWDSFKEEILSAGGNIQPIKVRSVKAMDAYEIVFGHRRHRACLDLGLPVLALVEELNELQLFEQMDRENRQRADLRPYEQGLMYARALDDGLYPSARKMAEALGVDRSNVGKALDLARLPKDILDAFTSPLEIQYGWVAKLNAALQNDLDVVLSVAKEIQKQVPRPNSKEVLKRLLGGWGIVPHPLEKPIALKGAQGHTGSIAQDLKAKSVVVTLNNVAPAQIEVLQKLIQEFIDRLA